MRTRHEYRCPLQPRRMSGDDLTIILFLVGTGLTLASDAMTAAGWKHPLFIRGLFGLAVIFVLMAATWSLGLKNISPAATAVVSQVATNPVSWFVVIMLGLAAALLAPKRGGRTPNPVEQRKPITPVATQAPPPVPVQTPAPMPKKIFVEVSPSYLMDLYKDRTSVQGDALFAAYIGKWMTVSGNVRDVSLIDSDLCLLQFITDDRIVSAQFREEIEKVSHIAELNG
jgi:hypothetical protein